MRSSLSQSPAVIFLIGSDPDRPGELPWPARAALAAADAVLHDGDVDPATLSLAPRGCLIEPAAADAARAVKLAREGWRVVWLAAGDPAHSPTKLADAAHLTAAGIAIRTIAGFAETDAPSAAPTPQPFATALNGLAG